MIAETECEPFARKPGRTWQKKETPPRGWLVTKAPQPEAWLLKSEKVTRKESSVERAIEASWHLLTLPVDWDDAGAQPISEETWQTAVGFLRKLEADLLLHAIELPAPDIGPCSDGSIDLHWSTAQVKLLVNIKSRNECDFYGERGKAIRVKGTYDPGTSDLPPLVWLFR